jgi:hypothetical protein
MLTTSEKNMLNLAGRTYKYEGAREQDIRTEFGNVTHYYQQLNKLIDTRPALEYAPALVNQLRNRRARRG